MVPQTGYDLPAVMAAIRSFKARHGLSEEADKTIATTLHLMHNHQIDLPGAQERVTRAQADHGVSGWFIDPAGGTLTIYQSRVSGARSQVLKGLEDLFKAAEWIQFLLLDPAESVGTGDAALRNLRHEVLSNGNAIRQVGLVLLSLMPPAEVMASEHFSYARSDLSKLDLRDTLASRGGGLSLMPAEFNLDSAPIGRSSHYELVARGTATLDLGDRSGLWIGMVRLDSLVQLVRKRGNLVFDKNVRLHLNTKESRTRVESPLEATLAAIVDGEKNPNLFSAYHVGVALTAADVVQRGEEVLSLEAPYIINGCQTVSVAQRFLARLEKEKQQQKVDRFREIYVLAKVITRAPEEELREVAASNNRQNPIEVWQLFSNDPVHVEIEAALQARGIFYERQKGKFASLPQMQVQSTYPNTNGTYVDVVGLAQGIALCRGELGSAAKPSEVFASKDRHDATFSADVPARSLEIVWTFNAMKALKRSLSLYLTKAAHADDESQAVLGRPVVRHTLFYLAMMTLVQNEQELRGQFAARLYKRASPILVDVLQPVWRRTVAKIKQFCVQEFAMGRGELSTRQLKAFADQLALEQGLAPEGPMPFGQRPLAWNVLGGPTQEED